MRLPRIYITLCAALLIQAGGLKSQAFQPVTETMDMTQLMDLSGIWLDEENHFRYVPFFDPAAEKLTVLKNFDLPSGVQTSGIPLYLNFEGLAWTAEIYLNGMLLNLVKTPFENLLIPLESSWLKPKENQIRVVMSREGKVRAYYPEPFVGILRPVRLLGKTQRSKFVNPQYQDQAEKVIVLAPWSSDRGPVDHPGEFEVIVQEVKLSGADAVFFPFPPSPAQLARVTEAGLKITRKPEAASQIAFYNSYQFHRGRLPYPPRFWRIAGVKTIFYGDFTPVEKLGIISAASADNMALFIFFAFPFFCLVLLRMFSIRVYESLPQFLVKPGIYLDLITGSKFMGSWETQFMNLFRIALGAVFAGMLLYFVSLTHGYERLNLISESSFLEQFLLSGDHSLYLLVGLAFVYMLILSILRYFILGVLGRIYGAYGLNQGMMGLDIFASFPLNLLPVFPLTLLFFTEFSLQKVILWLAVGTIVLLGSRRIWALWRGLGSVLRVSGSVKILYICAFEILPWLVLV